MSSKTELFLKLACVIKQAADAAGAPVTPAPAPLGKPVELSNPDMPGSKPADLTPVPVNEAATAANPPGLLQQGFDKAKALGGQAMDAAHNFQTPPWLQGGLDWVKQHPGISAGAGGLGVGALLAYMMTRRKRQQQPKLAASMLRSSIRGLNPESVAGRIDAAAGKAGGHVRSAVSLGQPMLEKAPARPMASHEGAVPDQVQAPHGAVLGRAADVAGGAGLGAVGASMAAKAHAGAANPNSSAIPQTGTGNLMGQAGDAVSNYAKGFSQPLNQWGAGQWGGVGAAALLGAILMKSRSDD